METELKSALKEFFEEYPLLKKFELTIPFALPHREIPSIDMKCPKCGSVRTFTHNNSGQANLPSINNKNQGTGFTFTGKTILFQYLCHGCNIFRRQFNVFFSEGGDYLYKFGQYPAYEIKIDKGLEKILGERSGLYKKGLVCESQGYGIGAFGYYRRIVEEIIDELLDSIEDLVPPQEIEKYQFALQESKKTHVASEKIDLVKDLLPQTLRPNNMNPLAVLHSNLSEGLHSLPEDECLDIAEEIRTVLIFLIEQILKNKEAKKQFTGSMQSILEKRNRRNNKNENPQSKS